MNNTTILGRFLPRGQQNFQCSPGLFCKSPYYILYFRITVFLFVFEMLWVTCLIIIPSPTK